MRLFAGLKKPDEMRKAIDQMQSFEYRQTAFEFSLIGSDAVVGSFNDMMQLVFSFDGDGGKQANPEELMRLWGRFLLAVRQDVGEPDTELRPTDMLRGYIKDSDKFLDH